MKGFILPAHVMILLEIISCAKIQDTEKVVIPRGLGVRLPLRHGVHSNSPPPLAQEQNSSKTDELEFSRVLDMALPEAATRLSARPIAKLAKMGLERGLFDKRLGSHGLEGKLQLVRKLVTSESTAKPDQLAGMDLAPSGQKESENEAKQGLLGGSHTEKRNSPLPLETGVESAQPTIIELVKRTEQHEDDASDPFNDYLLEISTKKTAERNPPGINPRHKSTVTPTIPKWWDDNQRNDATEEDIASADEHDGIQIDGNPIPFFFNDQQVKIDKEAVDAELGQWDDFMMDKLRSEYYGPVSPYWGTRLTESFAAYKPDKQYQGVDNVQYIDALDYSSKNLAHQFEPLVLSEIDPALKLMYHDYINDSGTWVNDDEGLSPEPHRPSMSIDASEADQNFEQLVGVAPFDSWLPVGLTYPEEYDGFYEPSNQSKTDQVRDPDADRDLLGAYGFSTGFLGTEPGLLATLQKQMVLPVEYPREDSKACALAFRDTNRRDPENGQTSREDTEIDEQTKETPTAKFPPNSNQHGTSEISSSDASSDQSGGGHHDAYDSSATLATESTDDVIYQMPWLQSWAACTLAVSENGRVGHSILTGSATGIGLDEKKGQLPALNSKVLEEQKKLAMDNALLQRAHQINPDSELAQQEQAPILTLEQSTINHESGRERSWNSSKSSSDSGVTSQKIADFSLPYKFSKSDKVFTKETPDAVSLPVKVGDASKTLESSSDFFESASESSSIQAENETSNSSESSYSTDIEEQTHFLNSNKAFPRMHTDYDGLPCYSTDEDGCSQCMTDKATAGRERSNNNQIAQGNFKFHYDHDFHAFLEKNNPSLVAPYARSALLPIADTHTELIEISQNATTPFLPPYSSLTYTRTDENYDEQAHITKNAAPGTVPADNNEAKKMKRKHPKRRDVKNKKSDLEAVQVEKNENTKKKPETEKRTRARRIRNQKADRQDQKQKNRAHRCVDGNCKREDNPAAKNATKKKKAVPRRCHRNAGAFSPRSSSDLEQRITNDR